MCDQAEYTEGPISSMQGSCLQVEQQGVGKGCIAIPLRPVLGVPLSVIKVEHSVFAFSQLSEVRYR